VRERLEKQLRRRAKELGFELTKIEPQLEQVENLFALLAIARADDEQHSSSPHQSNLAACSTLLFCARHKMRQLASGGR
jgi:hypothetical protein